MRNLFVTFLSFILVLSVISEVAYPQREEERFCRALDFAFNFEYGRAIRLLNQIQKENPDDLRPYFFKAIVYDRMVDNYDHKEENTRLFFTNIKKAEEIAKDLENQNKESWYVNFFLGGIRGWKGKYYLKKNAKWKTFVNGRKAKGDFEKTIKLKPDCFDAYYGLGFYHYYAGTLPKLLRFFLPLFNFEGDVEKGIEELKLAKDKGRYCRSFAAYELACIYSRSESEEDHKIALQLASELNEKYPQNFNFSYMRAVHYHNLKKDSLAIAVLNEMESKLDQEHYQSLSPDKKSDYYLCSGAVKHSMKRYIEAQKDFERICCLSASDGRKGEAYYYIGRSLSEQGRYKEAYQNFLKSLEHEDYFGSHQRAQIEIKKLKSKKLVDEK